jgi:hypothetical protein
MKDGNHQVTIQINLGLNPFGQASLALGYAHPDRFQRDSDEKIALTQVMPLMSSAITPGYARPASV